MIVPVLLALAVSAPPLEAPEELVHVERVLLPVRLTPSRNRPYACDGLRPDEVQVLEDGRPAPRIEAIEGAESRPTLHILLLDDSQSMTGNRSFARDLAARYVDALKSGESAAILTDGDSLTLRCAPTTDRARLEAAIRTVASEPTNPTWDHIEEAVRQFAGRPERKVLVPITDGIDGKSLGTFQEALGAASAVTDLSVFPIYPDRPETKRDEGGPEGAVARLASLAESTGGRVFTVRDVSRVAAIVSEIRAILGREVTIDYEPPATGKPREDGFRKIKIALVPSRKSCRAESVRPDRYSGPVDLAAPALIVPLWKVLARPLGYLRDDACPAGAFLHSGSRSIDGCTLDALDEYGEWMDPAARTGDFRTRPTLALRRFVVPIPPPEKLASSPGEVVLRWLVNDLPPSYPVAWASGSKIPGRIPIMLDGRAWLALRVRLGNEIFAHFEPYAEWLRAKLERDAPEDPDAAQAELRAAHPTRWDVADNLAAWLGDISAHDLAVQVERAAVNALFVGGDRYRDDVDRVVERWNRLEDWFPPPLERRVVGLPEPVFDRASGKIGFYRVVLLHTVEPGSGRPIVTAGGPFWLDGLPEVPSALLLARHLWADAAYGPGLRRAGVRLEAVEDRPLSRKDVRRLWKAGTLDDVPPGLSRSVALARIRVSIPETGGRKTVTYSGWVVAGGRKPPEVADVSTTP